jgi:serine/threonine-protein kinase
VGNTSCSPTCNVPVQVLGQGGVGFLTNVVTIGTGSTATHTLAISTTAPLANVTVPNVVGQPSTAAAAAILIPAGLTVGTVTITNNIAPAGQVLTQNPIAGASVAPGTAVNLTVSSGPVTVPNVVGQSNSAAANTILTGAGLTLGTVTSVANIAPVGQVLTQVPLAGTLAVPGTPVNLTVSSLLPPVSVSIDARMLKAAGFNTFEIVGQPGSLDTAVVQNLTLSPSTSAYTLRAPFGGGPGEKTLTFKVNAPCDLTVP